MRSPLATPCVLTPGQIDLWHLSLATVERGVLAHLCPQEQRRMERLRPPHDLRFGLGRGWLRLLLGRYLQCSAAAVEFGYAPQGKPLVAGVQFNLAHSGDELVCAVGCEGALGVDVERYRGLPRLEALSRRCLTAAERETFAGLSGVAAERRFFHYWSAKEAYLKATGSGLRVPMRGIQVGLEPVELMEPAGWELGLWPQEWGCVALVWRGETEVVWWREKYHNRFLRST